MLVASPRASVLSGQAAEQLQLSMLAYEEWERLQNSRFSSLGEDVSSRLTVGGALQVFPGIRANSRTLCGNGDRATTTSHTQKAPKRPALKVIRNLWEENPM